MGTNRPSSSTAPTRASWCASSNARRATSRASWSRSALLHAAGCRQSRRPVLEPVPGAGGRSGGHAVGDAHATRGLGAVAPLLPLQVEGADAGAGVPGRRRRAGRRARSTPPRTRGRRGPGRRGSWWCRGRWTRPGHRPPTARRPGARARPGCRPPRPGGTGPRWPGRRPTGPAPAPISNRPRSWSLVDPGAWRKAAPRKPSGVMSTPAEARGRRCRRRRCARRPARRGRRGSGG